MRDSSVYMINEASRYDKLYCTALNVITGNVSETVIPFNPENEKTVTHNTITPGTTMENAGWW